MERVGLDDPLCVPAVAPRPVRECDLLVTDPGAVRPHMITGVLGPLSSLVPGRFNSAISIRRSEEHTSELQSRLHLVCRLLLEKKKKKTNKPSHKYIAR